MPEQTSEKAEVKMYSDFKSLPQRYYPMRFPVCTALTAPMSMAVPCRWRSRPQHQDPGSRRSL